MSTIANDESDSMDAELEVRKLQAMVKNLEQQNQLLRSKQSTTNETSTVSVDSSSPNLYEANDNFVSKNHQTNCDGSSARIKNHCRDSHSIKENIGNLDSFDEVDLVDIDRISLEDETDWLYKSPKMKRAATKDASPYKWVRQDFERPSPDVETAKKSLLYKLDEVSRFPHSNSFNTLASLSSSTDTSTPDSSSYQRELSPPEPQPPTNNVAPSIKKPLFGLGSRVDNTTMPRPKKTAPKAAPPTADKVDNIPAVPTREVKSSPGLSPRDTPDRNGNNNSPRPLENSGNETDLRDVVDVQVLARMQEEDLRQSFHSPNVSPRKAALAASRVKNQSVPSLVNIDPEYSTSPSRASPSRFEHIHRDQAMGRSSNSLASLSSHSSSPPDSPYGSQYLDTKPHAVARSGGRNMSPARQQSPSRSKIGIPRPNTGIPRPGSASKLPGPRRSGIPAPNLTPARRPAQKQFDDSWKDGCY